LIVLYLYGMIKTICVCGAGTMGSGIAQVSAMAGFRTILFDTNRVVLDKARTGIEKNLERLCEKAKISAAQKDAAMQSILFANELNDCVADVVIEAIIEQPGAKQALFLQLNAINSPTTIFASNTSSISIDVIAQAIPYPERVAGMHFFNPAPLMKLVEIIRATQTSAAVMQELITLTKTLGKTPVICKDSPGFIVNRVARPYYLEAMLLVEQGLADPRAIDAAMEAAGFKMGPFALMDLIGMDINFNVSNIVWNALGQPERLKPSPVQEQKVKSGELGRKTGKGFYEY
jgi:3-hydroxybutyryl-CoA dehydrogenase